MARACQSLIDCIHHSLRASTWQDCDCSASDQRIGERVSGHVRIRVSKSQCATNERRGRSTWRRGGGSSATLSNCSPHVQPITSRHTTLPRPSTEASLCRFKRSTCEIRPRKNAIAITTTFAASLVDGAQGEATAVAEASTDYPKEGGEDDLAMASGMPTAESLDECHVSQSSEDMRKTVERVKESREKKETDNGSVLSAADLQKEVARRRNFAIISHPDAGKTTLTEKLLLYGGAIHEAGAVKARRAARHATSDWMELEQQRGISITSTALVFETKGFQVTLLDTPGHQDFGEDTYRTLAAADNAVMLIDAGKGLEPQTRKLFEVCRMRKLPIFTFINKMDRPSLDPLELIDEVEKEFELPTYPVNWPIGSGDRFMGVYQRLSGEVHLFERDQKHGSKEATVKILPWGDSSLPSLMDKDLYERLQDDIELLEELTPPLDLDAVHKGNLSLVFFGSAMNNFGVELFLDTFLGFAVQPGPHGSDLGEVTPDYPYFTGFVFKLQANMDPKHRDKVAFIRVCSGQFAKGMKVQITRTNKTIALTRPQKLFAQDRTTMETGFAGDVIGLNNPNVFCIGDTVCVGPKRSFPLIPSFSPELFCYVRSLNPSKYKQFQKGLTELLGEGAVQVLYSADNGRQDPILAAVGQLQFEVVKFRLLNEYGVDVALEPIGYTVARWPVGGWEAIERVGRLFNCATVKDMWGMPVLLFSNSWNVTQLLMDKPEIGELAPYATPPAQPKK